MEVNFEAPDGYGKDVKYRVIWDIKKQSSPVYCPPDGEFDKVYAEGMAFLNEQDTGGYNE